MYDKLSWEFVNKGWNLWLSGNLKCIGGVNGEWFVCLFGR